MSACGAWCGGRVHVVVGLSTFRGRCARSRTWRRRKRNTRRPETAGVGGVGCCGGPRARPRARLYTPLRPPRRPLRIMHTPCTSSASDAPRARFPVRHWRRLMSPPTRCPVRGCDLDAGRCTAALSSGALQAFLPGSSKSAAGESTTLGPWPPCAPPQEVQFDSSQRCIYFRGSRTWSPRCAGVYLSTTTPPGASGEMDVEQRAIITMPPARSFPRPALTASDAFG